MDAADDYELDYEAESPPRASQQVPTDAPFAEELEIAEAPSPSKRAESPVDSVDESPASTPRRMHRKRPLRSDKRTTAMVASLTRKLTHCQKRNAELQQQLHKFYQNDAIAFLENKARERQRQIDTLQLENRTLVHQQRALNAQIDELRDQVETMPTTRIAQREELRVCREQLRQYKDAYRITEEKSAKLHQQTVDLMTANKALTEKLKQRDVELIMSPSARSSSQRSASSLGAQEAEAVIASQEDEITRLQHRVEVMKKAIKLDQLKHEKQATAALSELEKARRDLEAFHQQVFEKEKVIRSQYLEIKQLKRSLKDAISHVQINQQFRQSASGREVRYPNHTHSQSTTKLNASGSTAQDLLSRLGLLQLKSSPSKASSVHIGEATSPPLVHITHQRRIPCPPSESLRDKKAPRSARSHAPPAEPPATQTDSIKKTPEDGTELAFPPNSFYEDVDQDTFTTLTSHAITTSIPGPAYTEMGSSFERDEAID